MRAVWSGSALCSPPADRICSWSERLRRAVLCDPAARGLASYRYSGPRRAGKHGPMMPATICLPSPSRREAPYTDRVVELKLIPVFRQLKSLETTVEVILFSKLSSYIRRAGLTIRRGDRRAYQCKAGALFSYAKPGFSYLWQCTFFPKKVDDLFFIFSRYV